MSCLKKFIAVLLALCLLLCLCAGCGKQSGPGGSSGTESSKESSKSSAPDATTDAGGTEDPEPPADEEAPSLPDGSHGAIWSVSIPELVGKPLRADQVALAGNGVVYTMLLEYIDGHGAYQLFAYDPATGKADGPLWEAEYVSRFSALEDGRLGVSAQLYRELRVLRLLPYSDSTLSSPVVPPTNITPTVAAGFDAYCCNDPDTWDLLLYDCGTEETTLIRAGDNDPFTAAIPWYLSPDRRYVGYQYEDYNTVYLYDTQEGTENAYQLPALEAYGPSYRPKAGIGSVVYLFENASGEGELTDRCWRIKDGGELEELTLPFQYRNGCEPLEKADAIIITDDNFTAKETEDCAIYLLDESGAAYVANYRLPANHWLSDAAVSGDRMVLSVYEGGRGLNDELYYLIETGFSKIG